MSRPENAFRTAMIGGFDRQDVLDYLDRLAKEHRRTEDGYRQTISKLEEQCAESRKSSDLSEKLSYIDMQTEKNEMENVKLEIERKQLETERRELEDERKRLEALREEAENARIEASKRADEMVCSVKQWYKDAEKTHIDYIMDINGTAADALSSLDKVREMVMAISSVITQMPFPSFETQETPVPEVLPEVISISEVRQEPISEPVPVTWPVIKSEPEHELPMSQKDITFVPRPGQTQATGEFEPVGASYWPVADTGGHPHES